MHVLRSAERSEAYVHLSCVIGALLLSVWWCVYFDFRSYFWFAWCDVWKEVTEQEIIKWTKPRTMSIDVAIYFSIESCMVILDLESCLQKERKSIRQLLDSRTSRRYKSISRSHLWSCDTRESTNGWRNLTSRAANIVKMMLVVQIKHTENRWHCIDKVCW